MTTSCRIHNRAWLPRPRPVTKSRDLEPPRFQGSLPRLARSGPPGPRPPTIGLPEDRSRSSRGGVMAPKAFASSADLAAKEQTLEVLADGVYALTAEGDPNVGAIEGEDFLVCFEAMATPVAARGWLERLREHTSKPVRYLVLSHYHAVRVLGASAFDAKMIVAHDN